MLCIAAQVSDGKVLERSTEGLVTSGVDRRLHFDRLHVSTLPRSVFPALTTLNLVRNLDAALQVHFDL